MSFLLDTCLLCDPTQSRPNAGVKQWFADTAETSMYVSVISIGEVRKGLAKLTGTPKATLIAQWLERDLLQRFDQRLLDVTVQICSLWGELCGELSRAGRPAPVLDSLIAATALTHGLTLVTRNVRDFENFDLAIVNPWS